MIWFGTPLRARQMQLLTSYMLFSQIWDSGSVKRNWSNLQPLAFTWVSKLIQECTVSIPQDKLKEIVEISRSWRNKVTGSKKALQSILGSLLYVTKCVRVSQVFLNRMLNLFRSSISLLDLGYWCIRMTGPRCIILHL